MARESGAPTERASKGGQARAAALTPEERAGIARKAAAARWSKARDNATVAVTAGILEKGPTTWVEMTMAGQGEPRIVTEAESWTVNSRSFVITPKRQGESSTR
jgi:hypothetical protein